MREIKFRGKRIKDSFGGNGQWVFGSLLFRYGKYHIVAEKQGKDVLYYPKYEVVKETVGQFSSLKDKKGVEIYNGDRIKVLWSEAIEGEKDETLTVSFDDGQFHCENIPLYAHVDVGCEVIGNIHEK